MDPLPVQKEAETQPPCQHILLLLLPHTERSALRLAGVRIICRHSNINMQITRTPGPRAHARDATAIPHPPPLPLHQSYSLRVRCRIERMARAVKGSVRYDTGFVFSSAALLGFNPPSGSRRCAKTTLRFHDWCGGKEGEPCP